METFSALLAICAGNSPEFPAQRPVTRSFDVFFDLHPNKRLSKQSWGWWFETLSCSLWRHCNETRGQRFYTKTSTKYLQIQTNIGCKFKYLHEKNARKECDLLENSNGSDFHSFISCPGVVTFSNGFFCNLILAGHMACLPLNRLGLEDETWQTESEPKSEDVHVCTWQVYHWRQETADVIHTCNVTGSLFEGRGQPRISWHLMALDLHGTVLTETWYSSFKFPFAIDNWQYVFTELILCRDISSQVTS